jgi:hypothetical protein
LSGLSHVCLANWLKENDYPVVPSEFNAAWSTWANIAYKYKVRFLNWPTGVGLAPGMPGFSWKMSKTELDKFWGMMLTHFWEGCARALNKTGSRFASLDRSKFPQNVPLIGFEKWTEGAFFLSFYCALSSLSS